MSKQQMAVITDSELSCYVCKRIIHDLKRVRTIAKLKDDTKYHTDRGLKLRNKCNQSVIEITGGLDKQRVFRHSRCHPELKHFSVEDL